MLRASRLTRRRFLGYASTALAATAVGNGLPRATRAFAPERVGQAPAPVQLTHVVGSTVKLEQIIGDYDKHLRQPTFNQTATRYGLTGTDLGASFEHNGKVYFLFGDNNAPGARDPMGYSESTDPDGPLRIDFFSRSPGTFIPIGPAGVRMGPFNVPTAGLSLEGVMYVMLKVNHSDDTPTDRSLLTRFDERPVTFTSLREMSQLPGGRFIIVTLRSVPGGLPGLPTAGPYVLTFGAGDYRQSHPYLAATPAQSFATGQNTRYFAGMNGTVPLWSDREVDAAPVFNHPTIGDLSVIYQPQLGLWLMLYDSREPRGILLRYAINPWGPWSNAEVVFSAERDRARGTFIHDPRIQPDDGLGGPTASRQNDPVLTPGAAYAPYLIERFTQIRDGTLFLQYLLSTWNPYTVVRLRSALAITAASPQEDPAGPGRTPPPTDSPIEEEPPAPLVEE